MENESKTLSKDKKELSDREKNRVLFSILIIIASLCVIVGVTYAAFQYQRSGEEKNKFTTGTLILKLDESMGEAISLENIVPMYDGVGLTQSPYQFSLRNEGTLASTYKIKLVYDQDQITEDNCGTKQLSYSQVKYGLEKNSVANIPSLLDTLSDYVIDAGTLLPGEENTYALRLWLDQSITNPADINGKHFHVRVQVEGAQTNMG